MKSYINNRKDSGTRFLVMGLDKLSLKYFMEGHNDRFKKLWFYEKIYH